MRGTRQCRCCNCSGFPCAIAECEQIGWRTKLTRPSATERMQRAASNSLASEAGLAGRVLEASSDTLLSSE